MLRKSLILGSITLLLVMLFALTGCEGPVGPAGPSGVDGLDGNRGNSGKDGLPAGFFLSGPNVTDWELEDYYNRGSTVILETSVATIYGQVPPGKTLVVLGTLTNVPDTKALAIEGTLEIYDGAILHARGIPGDMGVLTASESAVIKGNGAVVLPYVLGGTYNAGLHFASEEVKAVKRYPGSVLQNLRQIPPGFTPPYLGENPLLLAPSHLEFIYARELSNDLTVYNLQNLTSSSITANKKLTLAGSSNTLAAGTFNLSGSSSLIVAPGAVLGVTGNIATTTSGAATIINEGTINLGPNAAITEGTGHFFTNNGVITFRPSTDTDFRVRNLIGLQGSGRIELTPNNDFVLGRVPLWQHLVINGSSTITLNGNDPNPFDGVLPGKTITIGKDAGLSLNNSNVQTGAKLINNGTLFTSSSSTTVVEYLWYEMGYRGKIEASGALTGLIKNFEIPEGIELTLTNANSKLVSTTSTDPLYTALVPFDVIVKGTLILGNSAIILTPDGDVTIDGTLKLEDASLRSASSPLSRGGSVLINGALDTGTGSLVIAAGETLTIADSSKISGKAGLISINDRGALTIDGVKGYTTDGGGVAGEDFVKALADIKTAAGSLKQEITLDPDASRFNIKQNAVPIQVVGTVEIEDGSNPWFISSTDIAVNAYSVAVSVPADTEIVATAGLANINQGLFDVVEEFRNANSFVISIDNDNRLAISDAGWIGGSQGWTFGVISFNSVQFQNNGLIGPTVDPFLVGVKSKR
jgi:hypothetical protein